MKCFKCQSIRHHTAICKGVHEKRCDNKKEHDVKLDGPTQIVTHLTASKNSVMLQTVNVTVTDVKERGVVNCKSIFDGGSQQTYLSQWLVDKLKLNYIDCGEMRINAFGNTTGKLVSVKKY